MCRIKIFTIISICLLLASIDCYGVSTNYAINKDDFVVTDGEYKIILGGKFADLTYRKQEIRKNFVGETITNGIVYKHYIHEYQDLNIYTSNINYNNENRTINDFIISQIVLKTCLFKTSRNIRIGDEKIKVINSYGAAAEETENGIVFISYHYNNYCLEFSFKNSTVNSIMLYIDSGAE